MRIIRAEAMGMCFGVRQAVRTAMEVSNPGEVTIYGDLVHNEEVIGELERRGFQIQTEANRGGMPGTREVLITAHGVSDRERERLCSAGKELIDTTCPLVRRIHEMAQRLQQRGYYVIVIGKPKHVEVRGIVEDLKRACVVSKRREVKKYEADRLGVICQSTTAPSVAQEVLGEIYARNPGKEIHYIATFCGPTRKRQGAIRSLLNEVEAVVVVGGRKSNNTRELVKLARSRRVPCLHVQTGRNLRPDWFEPFEVVGLTAGTSTPDHIIEDVYQQLLLIASRKERLTLAHA